MSPGRSRLSSAIECFFQSSRIASYSASAGSRRRSSTTRSVLTPRNPKRCPGGLDETSAVPPERAARPDAASSVAPVVIHYRDSLRPCLRTSIAPRRRATFRQTLLDGAERCFGRALEPELGRTPAGRREERVDDLRRELGPAPVVNLRERFLRQQRAVVRPVGGHRVPGVREPDDRGLEGNVLAREPVRIAGAVPALVVVADDRDGFAETAELADDPRALGGVRLHLRVLPVVELARLDQDPVGNGDLADVVEEGPESQRVQARGRELELLPERERDLLYPQRVAGGVRVLGLDGGIEALDRLERALLEPAIRVEERLGAVAQLAR